MNSILPKSPLRRADRQHVLLRADINGDGWPDILVLGASTCIRRFGMKIRRARRDFGKSISFSSV